MKKDILKERVWALQRVLDIEKPESICASLVHSRAWLYKWVTRYVLGESNWYGNQSRRPCTNPQRTPAEIEEILGLVRLNLYNNGLFCGAQAIHWEMEELGV